MVAALAAMKTLSFPPSTSIVNGISGSPLDPALRPQARRSSQASHPTADALQSHGRLLFRQNPKSICCTNATVAMARKNEPRRSFLLVGRSGSDELQLDDLVQRGKAVDLAGADAVEGDLDRAVASREVHRDVAALAAIRDGDEFVQLVEALDRAVAVEDEGVLLRRIDDLEVVDALDLAGVAGIDLVVEDEPVVAG